MRRPTNVCTISPTSALPDITQAVTIDGYTQTGASPNTLAAGNDAALKIELNGASAGAVTQGIGITGPDSVVKGLIINRWTGIGVGVFNLGASNNRIEGNYIGTDASGAADLGNSGDGVFIESGSDNVVGGTSAGARNVISGNGFHGVEVVGAFASGNRILRNSIFDNDLLGISLDFGGGNDPGDADTGPNNLQNYPVITSATTSGGQTTIQGTLNSTANDTFNLQFFASPSSDPSGFGEGQNFVGQTNVTTNAGGNVAFEFTTAAPLGGAQVVTATATNTITDDTSEFSRAVEVEGDPLPLGCTIAGTPGNDILTGTSGSDSICGRGGNDRIDAGSGHDTVRGGDGNDTILGGSGSDTISGESGNDTAKGGAGNDDLSGGSGSDKLFGEAGKDALDARDGVKANDLADGGASADACTTDKNDRVVSCP